MGELSIGIWPEMMGEASVRMPRLLDAVWYPVGGEISWEACEYDRGKPTGKDCVLRACWDRLGPMLSDAALAERYGEDCDILPLSSSSPTGREA
mmetsp:Transcript_22267/g.54882  ORF Transcript_22267/g.54882 Transcript_22267/m.54882 type:complete len:94 (-) Transcript_22267:18-299(-)